MRPKHFLRLAAAVLALAAIGLACGGGASKPTGGKGGGGGGSSTTSAPARVTPRGTIALGAAAGGPSQITTTIRAATVEAAVGSEATAAVEALAVGAPGLGAWTIDVAYDPALVSVASCGGTEYSACNTKKDDHTVRLAGASGTGLLGDVTLMTLTFQCKAEGTSPLDLTIALLADATVGNPLTITASADDGSVTCT